VRRLFDTGRHKTIATLRADSSPRISGIECKFADSGSARCRGRKGADLLRDPRFALHGTVFQPQEGKEAHWPGEAKIAGRAVLAEPVGDGPAGDLFVAGISEVVITRLNPEATLLVIQSWTPHRGFAWWNANDEGTHASGAGASAAVVLISVPLCQRRRVAGLAG
jgi:hypothetical protein